MSTYSHDPIAGCGLLILLWFAVGTLTALLVARVLAKQKA